MIEYPTIHQASKAPREPCIGFNKHDGSNIRVKYTQKKGFCLFGSRHELFDHTHPHLAQVIPVFQERFAPQLTELFKKDKRFRDERELIVFGEFFGPNSFAGVHKKEDPKEFVMFDLMFIKKGFNEFMPPNEFVNTFQEKVRIAEVVHTGNLTDQVIEDVKGNTTLEEGVVFKGLTKTGAARGKIWMAKVKTRRYLQSLKDKFGLDWELYA